MCYNCYIKYKNKLVFKKGSAMRKKIISALLSALIAVQSASLLPAYANNTIADPKMEKIENKDEQNKSSFISKILPSNLSPSDLLIGAACVTGATAITVPLIYSCFHSSPQNNDQKSDIERKIAINHAVYKLFYDSESRNKILNFPYNDTKQILNSLNLNGKLTSDLKVSTTLHEVFSKAVRGDLKALDLSLTQNSNTLDILVHNTDTSKEPLAALHDALGYSDSFVKLPQKIKKAALVSQEFGTYMEPTYTVHSIGTDEVRDLCKQWQKSNGMPVRALKWHSCLCWLHASLLLFFHEKHYYDIICNFPIDDAMDMIGSGKLTEAEVANLKAMIRLSYTFRALASNPEDPAAYIEFSSAPGGVEHERDLVDKLRTAFYLNNTEYDDYFTKGMKYGSFFECVTTYILTVITKSADIKNDKSKNWHKFHENVHDAPELYLPPQSLIQNSFKNNSKSKVIHSGYHYWLRLSVGDKKLSVGENYCNPEKHIQIQESIEKDEPTHETT